MEYVHGGDIYTYKGMLDFSVNVNPLGPSERVIDAAKRGAERAMEYPDSRCGRLRKRWLKGRKSRQSTSSRETARRISSFHLFSLRGRARRRSRSLHSQNMSRR